MALFSKGGGVCVCVHACLCVGSLALVCVDHVAVYECLCVDEVERWT